MTQERPPDAGPVEQRRYGDLPIRDADTAASRIDDDATMLTSGFGSVGYPKQVPLALAESDRDLSLTVVHSGNVGDEIDVALVESGAIARRFSYQSSAVTRETTNRREIAVSDRNAASIGDEVQYGGMVDPDVAVVVRTRARRVPRRRPRAERPHPSRRSARSGVIRVGRRVVHYMLVATRGIVRDNTASRPSRFPERGSGGGIPRSTLHPTTKKRYSQ